MPATHPLGTREIGLKSRAHQQPLERPPVGGSTGLTSGLLAPAKANASRNSPGRVFIAWVFSALALTAGCATPSATKPDPPADPPAAANVISLNPQDWYILYSDGTPPHPTTDPQGAWAIQLPDPGSNPAVLGHLGYVETSFTATTTPHAVTVTFQVDADAAQYEVASGDVLPPTCHLFFEQKNDDLVNPNGRWWAPSTMYDIPSQNGQVVVMTIPLTPDQWTNVYGQQDATAFAVALANVGWFGITFGGQDFAGHGVTVTAGSSKFVLINYVVN
jgi:hypothetical protein